MLGTPSFRSRGFDQGLLVPSPSEVRETFYHFATDGIMAPEAVLDALVHVGLPKTSIRSVRRFIMDMAQMRDIDFDCFSGLMRLYIKRLEDQVCYQFDRFEGACSGFATFSDFKELLSLFGFNMSIAETLRAAEAAGLKCTENASLGDIFTVLRHLQGHSRLMSRDDQEAATKAFEMFARLQEDGQLAMPTGMLRKALVQIFGLKLSGAIANAVKTSDLTERSYTKEAFFSIVAKVMALENKMIQELFLQFDMNKDGVIDHTEAAYVLTSLGYTPLKKVICSLAPSNAMCSDEFAVFARAVRRCAGFADSEVAEIKGALQHAKSEAGGITVFDAIRLLRYVGYSPYIEDIYDALTKLDYMVPGAAGACSQAHSQLTVPEVMLLVRHFRERLLNKCRTAFVKAHEEEQGLLAPSRNGIAAGHTEPRVSCAHLERALRGLSRSKGDVFAEAAEQLLELELDGEGAMTFDSLVDIMDSAAKTRGNELQEEKGFSSDEVITIESVFRHCSNGKSAISTTPGCQLELHDLLQKFAVPLDTLQKRNLAFNTGVEVARRRAVLCGDKPDDGKKGAGSVGEELELSLPEVMHLLRYLADHYEDAILEQELRAMTETGFSTDEVEEFRSLFLSKLETHPPTNGPGAGSESVRKTATHKPRTPSPSTPKLSRPNRRGVTWSLGAMSLGTMSLGPVAKVKKHDDMGLNLKAQALLKDVIKAPRIPFKTVQALLKPLGSRDGSGRRRSRPLTQQIMNAMPDEEDDKAMDFPEFLSIMRQLASGIAKDEAALEDPPAPWAGG